LPKIDRLEMNLHFGEFRMSEKDPFSGGLIAQLNARGLKYGFSIRVLKTPPDNDRLFFIPVFLQLWP
jgi:hypothetical protein